MATDLNAVELRKTLQDGPKIAENPFGILRAVAGFVNDPETEKLGREFVLRTLEEKDRFGDYAAIVDALARSVGLFPYADPESFSARDAIAYEFHRPENLNDIVFHREQAKIYRRLMSGESVILSAPTSFGKSRVIDAVIASGKFRNIAVIVPTLALIDETRKRLSVFRETYRIVTQLTQRPKERNLFIFTAERAVAYEDLPTMDFFVVDEFYKIGAMGEDEGRTIALNQAFYRLLKGKGQFYLLGPNIERIPEGLEKALRCSFHTTDFSTVVVEMVKMQGSTKNYDALVQLARELEEPTLIFCSSPDRANAAARALLEAGCGTKSRSLVSAGKWLSDNYHPDWILSKALPNGIAVHHGRLPRSIGQFVVRAFNSDRVRFLVCTSTLIEGVNTKAKNVVIWDHKISRKPIDFFTFNNIKGRSGRMFQHFIGRVFMFNDPPAQELPFVDFPFFSQGVDTPDALLIQLDQGDLRPSSKDRMRKFSKNSLLSLQVLRQNSSISPESQLALADKLNSKAREFSMQLAWRKFPSWDQLKGACELIWEFFVGQGRNGAFSSNQLALKAMQLQKTPSLKERVLAELKPSDYAAKSADVAVERVLSFDRNWAGFDLPRFLMALSRIQQEVFQRRKLPAGDYSLYAAQLESLFMPPVLTQLDEFGIPFEVGKKIIERLNTTNDIDQALARLVSLRTEDLNLSSFEEELLAVAKEGL